MEHRYVPGEISPNLEVIAWSRRPTWEQQPLTAIP